MRLNLAVSDSSMSRAVRCRQLRRLGYSIGQIGKKLRLSESTVYWHTKDIRLTTVQRERLRLQKRKLMIRINAKRRGMALRRVMFRKPFWDAELVKFVAHLNFDGRIDRYGFHYYNRSKQQIRRMRGLARRLLGISPKSRRRQSGVWVMSYYHVEVASWLLAREHELLAVVCSHPDWQQAWLQALFDDEGHVHFSGNLRRVRASQGRPVILRLARQFLKSMAINSRIDTQAKALEITGRENLTIFSANVGFSSGIFINENRQNGIWQKPLEKRALLDFALSSYSN